MKKSVSLSHLQNQFIMSQERIIRELTIINENYKLQLSNITDSYSNLKVRYHQLQKQFTENNKILQMQRSECCIRNFDRAKALKYKEKYKQIKQQLKNKQEIMIRLQGQNLNLTNQKILLNDKIKQKQNQVKQLKKYQNYKEVSNNQSELLQIQTQKHNYYKQQWQKLRVQVQNLQKTLEYTQKQNQKLKKINQNTFQDLHSNLEKIFEKVTSLEKQNNQLRECHSRKCQQNQKYGLLIQELTEKLQLQRKKRKLLQLERRKQFSR